MSFERVELPKTWKRPEPSVEGCACGRLPRELIDRRANVLSQGFLGQMFGGGPGLGFAQPLRRAVQRELGRTAYKIYHPHLSD
jgi:hypothetical protein